MLRSACPLCNDVLSAESEAALNEAHVEHLGAHFYEHCEAEVEAGRAERVVRDGKTLYRFHDDPRGSADTSHREPRS